MSKKMTRLVVALLLVVTFTAGAAQASPWSLDGPEASPIASLWDWVASWLEPTEPAAIWMEGCGMDPNGGGCHHGSTTDPADPNS
jgi:hypothetical protein